jgi:hypothetical protein
MVRPPPRACYLFPCQLDAAGVSGDAEENTEEVSTGTGVPLVASEGRAASSTTPSAAE